MSALGLTVVNKSFLFVIGLFSVLYDRADQLPYALSSGGRGTVVNSVPRMAMVHHLPSQGQDAGFSGALLLFPVLGVPPRLLL